MIKKLKAELKVLAETIRISKANWKQAQRESNWSNNDKYSTECVRAQCQFRYKHIVRCLLRGRTMEQIENVDRTCEPHSRNKPNDQYIKQLLKEYSNEAVCSDQSRPVEEPASSPGRTCCSGMVSSQPSEPVEQNSSVPEGDRPLGTERFRDKAERLFSKCWRDLLA